MKKTSLLVLLAFLSFVALPACAAEGIKISALPAPSVGTTSLAPGDIVPGVRGGVTYGLTFPSYPASGVAISTGTAWGTSGTLSGNTSVLGTTSGTLTSGHCVSIDANGNLVDAGAACSASSQWTTSGSNIYYTTGAVSVGTNVPASGFDFTVVGKARTEDFDVMPSSSVIYQQTDIADIYLDGATTGGAVVGRYVNAYVFGAGSATSGAHTVGLKAETTFTDAGYLDSAVGVEGSFVYYDASGTLGTVTNFAGYANFGSDTDLAIGTYYGVNILPNANLAGTITNYIDYNCPSIASLGGTITNKYCLYNADSGKKIITLGSVGIGTTSPAYNLDVTGTVHATGAATLDGLAGSVPQLVAVGTTGELGKTHNGTSLYFFNSHAGQYEVSVGTAGAPVTDASPTLKISRTDATPVGSCANKYDSECNAALSANAEGGTGATVQTSAIIGNASNAATASTVDSVGVQGQGKISGAGTGVATGGYFTGRRSTATALALGIEARSWNNTAANCSYSNAGLGGCVGLYLTTSGNGSDATTLSSALQIGNSDADALWHSAITVNSGTIDPTGYVIDDVSSSAVGISLGGTKTYALITAPTAGNVGIGTVTPAYTLDVNGTIHATGNVTLAGTGNSVGTITSGTWNGSAVDTAHGGTNATTVAAAQTNLAIPTAQYGRGFGYPLSITCAGYSNCQYQSLYTSSLSAGSNWPQSGYNDVSPIAWAVRFSGGDLYWNLADSYGLLPYQSVVKWVIVDGGTGYIGGVDTAAAAGGCSTNPTPGALTTDGAGKITAIALGTAGRGCSTLQTLTFTTSTGSGAIAYGVTGGFGGYGDAGETSTQFLARIADVVASTSNVVLLNGFALNDVNAGISVATMESNLTTIYTTLLNAGKIVVDMTEGPINVGVTWDANDYKTVEQINRWRKNYIQRVQSIQTGGAGRLLLLDTRAEESDATSATGATRANFRDTLGVHYTTPAAMIQGWKLWKMLQSVAGLSGIFTPYGNQLDVYDATYNPYGFITANPWMTGTGGSKDAKCTGDVATSWTLQWNPYIGADGTGTCVGSIESSRTDLYTGTRQVITLSNAASTKAREEYQLYQFPSLASLGLSAGDYIEAECYVEPTTYTKVSRVGLTLTTFTAATATTGVFYDGGDATKLWNEQGTLGGLGATTPLKYVIPKFQIPASTTKFFFALSIAIDGTGGEGTGTAEFKVTNCGVRKAF